MQPNLECLLSLSFLLFVVFLVVGGGLNHNNPQGRRFCVFVCFFLWSGWVFFGVVLFFCCQFLQPAKDSGWFGQPVEPPFRHGEPLRVERLDPRQSLFDFLIHLIF